MKKSFLITFCAMCLSCTSERSVPDNVLDSEKMEKLMAELHLTEIQVSKMDLKLQDSSIVAYKVLEQRVFKKYDTDSTQYKRSYDFYATHPSKMIKIYEGVEKQLKN